MSAILGIEIASLQHRCRHSKHEVLSWMLHPTTQLGALSKRERSSVAFLQTNYTFFGFYSPLKTFKNSMLYSGKIWFMNNSFIRNVQYIDDDDVSVAIYVFEVLFFIRVLFLCMKFPVGKVILVLPDSLNIFQDM